MIREPVRHGDRERLPWQSFDYIPNFQVVLAIAVGSQPPGCQVVHAIRDYQMIVINLRDFMAKSGDIENRLIPEDRLVPRGIVHDEKPRHVSVIRVPTLEIKRMESTDAADVPLRCRNKQISRRKEERRDVL